MVILVNIKQLGKRKSKIYQEKFYIEHKPGTIEELIRECVSTCVKEYNNRFDNGDNPRLLSQQCIDDMSEIGKIAFGINYGEKKADKEKAIEDALLAYEDGLFRISEDATAGDSASDAGAEASSGASVSEFRLPKDAVVKKEIENVKALGVKIETDVVIGKSVKVDELMEKEGFEAVFIGSGAGLPRFMNIPGEQAMGVFLANEFLTRSNLMKAFDENSRTPIMRPNWRKRVKPII